VVPAFAKNLENEKGEEMGVGLKEEDEVEES
jgi:hypothetical protein